MPIRLAIADDQKLFRRGLRLMLEKYPDIELVFEAENGKQLLERLQFEPVDVIILDVEMPEMDGMKVLSTLRAKSTDPKVIMLTMFESERLINHLMQDGANGFLLKDEEPAVVYEAIQKVVEEGVYFRDYVSRALLKGQRAKHTVGNGLKAQLSDRELEILQLICQEYTSQEIADKLFISVRTVDGHRRKLQEKTGTRNLAGLVLYAVNHGLI